LQFPFQTIFKLIYCITGYRAARRRYLSRTLPVMKGVEFF